MTREIKFRVWDGLNGKYCTELDAGEVFATYAFNNGEKAEIVLNPLLVRGKQDDFIPEQYTGLKDKNSKEIYEGDIVKGRWWRARNARLDTEGEIKFNDGWFYIKDDPDGQDRLGVPIHNCYNLEVIGNIHENKELMKGEEND